MWIYADFSTMKIYSKAPNLTPAPVIPIGLPEAELIAYIAEAKYLLGEPLTVWNSTSRCRAST